MIASLAVELMRAIRLTLAFALVTGLLYSLALTGVAQVIFPNQANGGLITKNGQVVGSALIGQEFKSDKYFHGRVSASATPYAADNSGGSNLGPNNKVLIDRVASTARTARADNGLAPDAQVPVDLVTADFSGFDPDITEASALLQVHRVSVARSLDEPRLRTLVERYVRGRVLWIFGEPHVNVLQLNMALDAGETG